MIKLFDNWVVLVDKDNYTLAEYFGERLNKKTRKMEKDIKVYGYYMSLSAALNALRVYLIRQKLSDGCRSLSEAIQTIAEADDKIAKLLESVKWEEDDGE